ncbi:MAG: hypothetical protein EP330_08205 [Deltaproteobacteria bacterium]|nr:MAG: hypothetical protein EP330_08205 [Deltaproteobacteria bacterium]
MIVLIAAALAWSPLDVPVYEPPDTCEPERLDLLPVEMPFVERVFAELRECPVDDPCCNVGGFAWWEPAEGPDARLLRAPGCAPDACGHCGFELVAIGHRERVCTEEGAKVVFRPFVTVTRPTHREPAFPERVAWVMFPGMPDYQWEPTPEPELPVLEVHELEVPDTREAAESVAGGEGREDLPRPH